MGGGIRTVERARDVLDAGVHAVIVSSALFRDGKVDVGFARTLADAVGAKANVLVGGFNKSFTLQPVSIEGSTGLNVAAGVAALTLESAR